MNYSGIKLHSPEVIEWLKRNQEFYKGKYVIVENGKCILFGLSERQVVEKAKNKGLTTYTITFVSRASIKFTQEGREYYVSQRRKTRIPRGTVKQIVEKYKGRCFYCGTQTTRECTKGKFRGGNRSTIDHLIPYFRGGTADIENLVLACSFCNLEKHKKTLEEYRTFKELNTKNPVLFYGETLK